MSSSPPPAEVHVRTVTVQKQPEVVHEQKASRSSPNPNRSGLRRPKLKSTSDDENGTVDVISRPIIDGVREISLSDDEDALDKAKELAIKVKGVCQTADKLT